MILLGKSVVLVPLMSREMNSPWYFQINSFTFAQVDKSLGCDLFCVTFANNLSLTIEPLCIKQQKEIWMWDRSEYHSIFDLIILDTNEIAQSDFILQSNCLKKIVNKLFHTFQNFSICRQEEFVDCKQKNIHEGRPRFFMLIMKEKRS